MEIPLESRDKVNQYIRDTFIVVPNIVSEFEKKARALPIPPHHIKPDFGKLLQILVAATASKNILEIGTMWGYSAWWMHRGLVNKGSIITLEKELKHYTLAKEFFSAMHMNSALLHHVDALEYLTEFDGEPFDFVFIDADKREYPQFLELVTPLMKSGAMLVVDNIIFSSSWNNTTVADETDDERIQQAQKFNALLACSDEFIAVPIPVHSGIMIATKI